jgi:hypothetical protein
LKILLFSLFLSLIAAHAQQSKSVQPSLSLTITAPETVVRAGSPLSMKITATNTSGHDVSYIVSTLGGLYDIYVHDAAGALAPETPEGAQKHFFSPHHRPSGGSVFSARAHLEAGAKQEIKVEVTKEYDRTKPGKYTVYVERPDPENKGKQITSNTITITVTP